MVTRHDNAKKWCRANGARSFVRSVSQPFWARLTSDAPPAPTAQTQDGGVKPPPQEARAHAGLKSSAYAPGVNMRHRRAHTERGYSLWRGD